MPARQWRRQLQGDGEFNPVPVGGEGFFNPEPTPFPGGGRNTFPSPTPFPTATPQARGDNSNAGLVNRTLFDNQANRDWWSTDRPMEPVSGRAGGNLAGIGAGMQGAYPFGEPTVQVPTSDARYSFDFDSAPSLFGNPNDWWRQGEMAQGAATGNDGGGIWSGTDTMGEFGGDLNLGSDLFASLDSMQFGEDYPEAANERPLNVAENTSIPVEPDFISQDYEWTTSPGDRRFLPDPQQPSGDAGGDPNAGRISTGGTSLSNFGGSFSLGSDPFTPLALMNFGGGYPQNVPRGDGLMTGVVTAGGLTDEWGTPLDDFGSSAGQWVERADGSGSDWRENAAGNTSGTGNGRANDGTGTTTVSIPQGGGTEGFTIIGTDTVTGAPIYQDSQGNRFVNPGTGIPISAGVRDAIGRDYSQAYGQSSMSRDAARNMAMANWGMGIQGSPLRFAAGDAGRDWFGSPSKGTGYVNEETGTVLRKPSRGLASSVGAVGGRGR